MGRWAHFHYGGDDMHDYKFWFGIQNSKIPWAKERESIYVPDYDEQQANENEFTDQQKEWWKEWEGQEYEGGGPEGLYETLDFIGCKQYDADDSCDAEEIRRRWRCVDARARRLGILPYSRKEGEGAIEALVRWEEEVLTPFEKKITGKASDKRMRRLADLHLMTTICAVLVASPDMSYTCHYEV